MDGMNRSLEGDCGVTSLLPKGPSQPVLAPMSNSEGVSELHSGGHPGTRRALS